MDVQVIHHATAVDAKDIARLLRSSGRIIVTAPARSGKTTELIKYAEERYVNGRFAVVCPKAEDHKYIIRLHWQIWNELTFSDVVAKRLLGQPLEGEDVNPPLMLTPENLHLLMPSTPVFVDSWNCLPESAHRAILKKDLFIAAVQGELNAAKKD